MKIVVDGRMLEWTGVGRYTEKLLDNLQKIDQENDYLVLTLPKSDWRPKAKNFKRIDIAAEPYSVLGEQLKLAKLLYQLRPSLVHFTSINRPALYLGRAITTIHDLHMLDYSAGNQKRSLSLKALKQLGIRLVAWTIVRTSKVIVVPSNYVKDVVLSRYRIKETKVVVTHEAADKLPGKGKALSKYQGSDFLFYVGNAYPNKNLSRLLEAFAYHLSPRYKNLHLVLAGKEDEYYRELKRLVKERGIKNVHFPGYISDEQLVWLYRQAKVVVLPSLEEGFGLQSLEAMQYGAPLVVSDIPVFREVVGEAGVYFDPLDIPDIGKTLERVVANEKLRKDLVTKGTKRATGFSWHKMTKETLAIYKKAV